MYLEDAPRLINWKIISVQQRQNIQLEMLFKIIIYTNLQYYYVEANSSFKLTARTVTLERDRLKTK